MTQTGLDHLADLRRAGTPCGITSVCSAHPVVLRAALRHGRETGATVLIEATCNQVNHQGGYTGMQPADFAALVGRIAEEEGCPAKQIVLGGDHLGPNPWRDQPAEAAMAEAEKMVEAYVAAGFRKIHLDASMGCAGEPVALDDDATAKRAVRLAAVAERTAAEQGGEMPRYIIGTEVPPPGGADHALDEITPTAPEAARMTIAVHRQHFVDAGLSKVMDRVIGIVVQPGVEFGNHNVIAYDRSKVQSLIRILDDEPRFVFEAHSTDYQGTAPLSELVEDGFPILKVGPELTFVLREALYALDLIASDLIPDYGDRPLMKAMEEIMLAAPGNWNRHYTGDAATQAMLRHYSLSDRIRYYWASKAAEAAVARLSEHLDGQTVPLPLMRQHLPAATRCADKPLNVQALLIWRVSESLRSYHAACRV
ncbi:D-tagatose-bisphosphate aldolase, class II, non-catalytic subunit [Aurantimonas marina]|uniref:D-tagatose-bisphosphate aldolase, class II, non-catalytic subunit n=1 Tax=Aurantimonas marina TaxID=2780508 RepID=UPI0019CF64B2|nr:D-tagatose-bisphosphate aldolase, class II, non-catalytic subunit [Aurantimonas marina]